MSGGTGWMGEVEATKNLAVRFGHGAQAGGGAYMSGVLRRRAWDDMHVCNEMRYECECLANGKSCFQLPFLCSIDNLTFILLW